MKGNLSKSKTLKGEEGQPGNDGYSPKVTVTDIENGHNVTIQDAYGLHSFVLKNGDKGEDGISPIVNVTATEEGQKIEITDKEGKKEFVIKNTEINPDLAQNDETAPDYVKNRTHYEETKSVVKEVVTAIDGVIEIHLTNDFELNKKYKFIVKNQVHEIMFEEEGTSVNISGDVFTLYNFSDAFYIVTPFGRGYEEFVGDIYEEKIVTLPEKYIPDSIARKRDLITYESKVLMAEFINAQPWENKTLPEPIEFENEYIININGTDVETVKEGTSADFFFKYDGQPVFQGWCNGSENIITVYPEYEGQNVSLYKISVKQLDDKYISDSIARVADVEAMIGIVNDELESILNGGVE